MDGFQNMKCECLRVCCNSYNRALSLCVFEECIESERMNCVGVF